MTAPPPPPSDPTGVDAPDAVSPLAPPVKRAGLIKSSAIFAGLTLVSRFMGLARDIVITARLGASLTIAADAYYTALSFPNLFRRIFAEGAFAAAFVPSYARRLTADGEAAADKFATDALATVAAATAVLTIACQLAMPWLMFVINPGYVHDPEKFRLAVVLTQITMPYLPCMTVAALLSGVLNARGRFIISGAYPTVLNAVMLAVVLPQHDPVQAAYAASVGVIFAGIGQGALIWWGVRRTGARIGVAWPTLNPEIKALLRKAVPAVIANSATQINLFISGILASQVAGLRGWMAVADRLYQLPMSLVGVALGTALLPRLSQAIAAKDDADSQGAMDQAMVFALAFSLPAAAALLAMPIYLIDALYTRGAFAFADSRATGLLLFHYGWCVPAFVLLRVLQPAFFARQDTRTPMKFSLISVGVNIVLGLALFYAVGFQGLAAATSIAAWVSVLQMAFSLWKTRTYRPGAAAWAKMIRVAAASTVLGLVLFAAAHFRPLLEAPFAHVRFLGLHAKEITVLLVCAAGGLTYPALLFAFGGVTPAEVKAVLRRRGGGGAALP